MKKLIIALVCGLIASNAFASPYFRFIGQENFQINAGACLDPKNVLVESQACSSIPLIYHAAKDGYVIIPNEDWALLSVGGGIAHGDVTLNIGPAMNVTPVLKHFILNALILTTKQDQLVNLKTVFVPIPESKVDVTFSVSPQWSIHPMKRFFKDSAFTVFVGPALHF